MNNCKVCVKCNLLFEVCDTKNLLPSYDNEVKICKFCSLLEKKCKDNNVTQRRYKHR